MLLAGLLLACIKIDLMEIYNALPYHVAHSPTIKRANMQTVFVVIVTVKNRLLQSDSVFHMRIQRGGGGGVQGFGPSGKSQVAKDYLC